MPLRNYSLTHSLACPSPIIPKLRWLALKASKTGTPLKETVLGLINKLNNVPLTASDISIAHCLAKTSGDPGPPRIIVRFVNRKVRDAVYAARRQLRSHTVGNDRRIYINEGLTSHTAELFRNACNIYTGAGLQVGLSL